MDNQQIPAADSKFQKIARKNHRKWKIRLLSKGGQKSDAGGGPYSNKPDYNRAKSAPPGFGGSLEESQQLDEVIRKKGSKYCLMSKKTGKSLGCYPTRAGAVKRERQVQYFKHVKESRMREEISKILLEIGVADIFSKIFSGPANQNIGDAQQQAAAQSSSQDLEKIKSKLNPQQGQMAQLIYNEFIAAKLHPNIALAAIVNASAESGLNPNASGDHGHSIGLFQLNDNGGAGVGMTAQQRQDPVINTRKIIEIVKKYGNTLITKANEGAGVPELASIYSRDIERPANKEAEMVRRSAEAQRLMAESNSIRIIFGQTLLQEKNDRCTRIAKRKYKAWPSAYASGAVVKCRQGKIWKGIKEEGQELEEEWSSSERKKRKANCSNPKGFTMKQFCKNQRTKSKEGEKKNEGQELDEERKLGKPSSETSLRDWFKRKGAPGKKGGWVDCNTCKDGKCKPCGRQGGENRSKYPRCRPTPSQCKGYKRRHSNLQRDEE